MARIVPRAKASSTALRSRLSEWAVRPGTRKRAETSSAIRFEAVKITHGSSGCSRRISSTTRSFSADRWMRASFRR